MERCINKENGHSIYASTCNPTNTQILSDTQKLICPTCKERVIYKKGTVNVSHFSHFKKCTIPEWEDESDEHILGKTVIFNWLKRRFPTSYVEIEEYIPETGQIADVLLIHNKETSKQKRIAFEFQRSSISIEAWKKRHELYRDANIVDYWLFDESVFLKYSKNDAPTGARTGMRKIKEIFKITGFTYFLNPETKMLTIDAKFIDKGKFEVHDPINNSFPLGEIDFRFRYLSHENIKQVINNKIKVIIHRCKEERKKDISKKVSNLSAYAKTKYEKDLINIATTFIQVSKENSIFRKDMLLLTPESLFEKYDSFLRIISNNKLTLEQWKSSDNIRDKIKFEEYFYHCSHYISDLKKQGEQNFDDYIESLYFEKINMTEYIYTNHIEVLRKILNAGSIDKLLKELNQVMNWSVSMILLKKSAIGISIALGNEAKNVAEVNKAILEIKRILSN